MHRTRMVIGAFFASTLVSGCFSTSQTTQVRPASLPKPPPRQGIAAMSPADYVATAGAIDLYVIKASELALQRSTTPRVREVATRLIEAHRGSSAQLSMGGRRLNLLPSGELQPRHRALLEQLYSSPAFDRDFAQQMQGVHQEAALLHSNYATGGTSPTLTQIARFLAPMMEQQGRLVSYL
jgi:putative membrane protein